MTAAAHNGASLTPAGYAHLRVRGVAGIAVATMNRRSSNPGPSGGAPGPAATGPYPLRTGRNTADSCDLGSTFRAGMAGAAKPCPACNSPGGALPSLGVVPATAPSLNRERGLLGTDFHARPLRPARSAAEAPRWSSLHVSQRDLLFLRDRHQPASKAGRAVVSAYPIHLHLQAPLTCSKMNRNGFADVQNMFTG